MEQSPTTLIDNDEIVPARTVKSWEHTRKTVLAGLSQIKKHKQWRGTRSGLWLCTDASEPQFSSVTLSINKHHEIK